MCAWVMTKHVLMRKRVDDMSDHNTLSQSIDNIDNELDAENYRLHIINLVNRIDDVKLLKIIYQISHQYYLRG